MNPSQSWYEILGKKINKHCTWLVQNKEKTLKKNKTFFNQTYLDTLRFSGLALKPYEILIFSYAAALFTFLGLLFIDTCILLIYYSAGITLDFFTGLLMILTTVLLPLVILNMVACYPKTYIQYSKIHSLGDIPEVLSYLVMYLKLVPNLELSVKFAVMESATSLVHDLRKMLWDMQIRIHHGIDDALTQFANQWGPWSEHFKRSLHLIRSSVHESAEAQREITLNKALDIGLEGTREQMNEFAAKLHQPTLIIYSIGIMIPLAIIAMLPAAGLIGLQITIFQMFFLYDIILPLILFIYMRKILLSRPATFNPPKIPHSHPEIATINKQKHAFIAFVLSMSICFIGLLSLLPHSISSNESIGPILQTIPWLQPLNEWIPLSLFIIWGIALGISYYTHMVYQPYKRIRDSIKHMEREFSDSLYIMGKRIGEEKSPEESFLYTAQAMKGSVIATVFLKTGYNLASMHTTIHQALFSPEYGSLKHVYSTRITSIMRLFVEGIKKSQQSVSISLVKLADHLKELQKVELNIKETLGTLTSTLRSTATLFAPMIAGVTLSITQLISVIISKMTQNIPISMMPLSTDKTTFSGMANTFSLHNIQPEYFVLVIGIYVIELVVLLTRFTNGIDEGDDQAQFMYTLGKALPIAVGVLTVTIIISNIFLSSIATHI